jgi:hypothetical protein
MYLPLFYGEFVVIISVNEGHSRNRSLNVCCAAQSMMYLPSLEIFLFSNNDDNDNDNDDIGGTNVRTGS